MGGLHATATTPKPSACSRARRSRFPRSDYRPPFLYWAARAHDKLDAAPQADARLRLVYTDYANSYYGRLAERQLAADAERGPAADVRLASRETPAAAAPAPQPIPTDAVDPAAPGQRPVRRCARRAALCAARVGQFAADRCDDRLGVQPERGAAPRDHADAARVPAAPDRGRPAAAGRDAPGDLSADVLGRDPRQSAAHGLDPYLVAALIAQESTFDPGVKSVANAWGLMQLVPATGRRLARSLGIRRFTTAIADQPGDQHPARHVVFLAAGRAVRRHLLRAGELQRRRKPHRPLESGAARPGRGRVHRRHPVPRDAELREADSRHGGGLPAALRFGRRHAAAASRDASPAAAGKASAAKPASKKPPAPKKKAPAKKQEAAREEAAVEDVPPPDEDAIALALSGERDDFVQRHVGIARERPQVPAERLQPLRISSARGPYMSQCTPM